MAGRGQVGRGERSEGCCGCMCGEEVAEEPGGIGGRANAAGVGKEREGSVSEVCCVEAWLWVEDCAI